MQLTVDVMLYYFQTYLVVRQRRTWGGQRCLRGCLALPRLWKDLCSLEAPTRNCKFCLCLFYGKSPTIQARLPQRPGNLITKTLGPCLSVPVRG